MNQIGGGLIVIATMGLGLIWYGNHVVKQAERNIENSGASENGKLAGRTCFAVYLGIVFVIGVTGFGQSLGLGALALPVAVLGYIALVLAAVGWALVDGMLHRPRTVFGQARFEDKRDEAGKAGLK